MTINVIFVLISCFVGWVSADPRVGFNVGTTPGGTEVVSNGISKWNQDPRTKIEEDTFTVNFYVSLSLVGTQPFQFTNINYPEQEIVVNTTTVSGSASQAAVVMIPFRFICQRSNVAKISATIVVIPYDSILIQFDKSCESPFLNVGTNPEWMFPEVMEDGVLDPLFVYHVEGTLFNSTTFYFWLNSSSQANVGQLLEVKALESGVDFDGWGINSISTQWVSPNNDSVAYKKPIGPDAKPLALVISYSCTTRDVVTKNAVRITIDYGWKNPFNFTYYKNCSAMPRPGLFVGTHPQDSDLISNGFYTDKISRFQPWLVENAWSFPVYIQLNDTKSPNQTITVSVQSSSSLNISSNVSSIEISRVMKIVNLNFTCLASGFNQTFPLTLDFSPYARYDLTLNYECYWPPLSIGFAKGEASICRAGEVQSFLYEAGNSKTDTFYIWLDRLTSPYESQQYQVVSMTFDIDKVIPTIRYTGPTSAFLAFKPQLDTPPDLGIEVSYKCKVSETTTLNMTLDVGYRSRQISFGWTKDCRQPPLFGDSGWTAVGIFFFVVFLLVVVFCVSSCSYNYIQRGKTGWDVVPGIEYYRRCYDRFQTPPNRTPQTDYTIADSGSSSTYGSTYQSEL